MAIGQSTWESRGYGSNEYVINPETSKNIAKEYRFQSVLGKLSRPMKNVTVGQGQEARQMDIGASACIWTKEIKSGDEVRFTLEQNMSGPPTYGDAPVRVGNYLAYLHQTIFLNAIDTPAVPLPGGMSLQRVRDVISDTTSRIRTEITMYLAEQYVYDVFEAHLRGASRTLSAARADGGRAINLGLGAGVQVSPENFLVPGVGFVSGVSGTSAYETNVETALGTLTDTAGDKISRTFIHNLRAALTQKKISGSTMDGSVENKWYAMCDPDLLTRLSTPGGELANLWAASRERAKSNPVYGHGAIELDDIIFCPDQRLKQFRADISSGIVWGENTDDRRAFVPTSNIALMIIMGNGAILEGHNGSVDITHEKGFHGKGQSYDGHVKQAFMRARWVPQDGRTGIVLNQSSMTVAFYEPGIEW